MRKIWKFHQKCDITDVALAIYQCSDPIDQIRALQSLDTTLNHASSNAQALGNVSRIRYRFRNQCIFPWKLAREANIVEISAKMRYYRCCLGDIWEFGTDRPNPRPTKFRYDLKLTSPSCACVSNHSSGSLSDRNLLHFATFGA